MSSIFVIEARGIDPNGKRCDWTHCGECGSERTDADTQAEDMRAETEDEVRVATYERSEPWVLTTERLPAEEERVEFIERGEADRSLMMGTFFVSRDRGPRFGLYAASDVLCWRPARPIGAIPEAKETSGA